MTELNYNGVAPEPEEFILPADTSMSYITTPLLGAVSTPLEGEISDSQDNPVNSYVVYAAIDLMNLVFSRKDPAGNTVVIFCYYNFQWRFSSEQLYVNNQAYDDETGLAGYNSIREVMDYLMTRGVCKEEEYNKDQELCERVITRNSI